MDLVYIWCDNRCRSKNYFSSTPHPGHMTKMATMAIYVKNFKNNISQTKRLMTLKLGI